MSKFKVTRLSLQAIHRTYLIVFRDSIKRFYITSVTIETLFQHDTTTASTLLMTPHDHCAMTTGGLFPYDSQNPNFDLHFQQFLLVNHFSTIP